MCISYSSCWHKEYISWLALPEFGTLIQPDDFLKDIQTYDYIRAAYELQKTVMSIVNQYDASFGEDTSTEKLSGLLEILVRKIEHIQSEL